MTPQQTQALARAQDVKRDDLRVRAIMLVLANNVTEMRMLEQEVHRRNDTSLEDWIQIDGVADTLQYGVVFT
jgi:dTDP-glucose pyrophosphorylase